MNRTPPIEVRRLLRKEVGFGCPVPDCGSPYLCWHHFDPPWHEKEHHNPDGMLALCREHHDKADAGAFTKEQLRTYKQHGTMRAAEIKGRFDWMRHEILAVVGGNYYYQTPVIFEFRNEPAIWFNRDDEGYMLLNIRMLTKSGQPRLRIEDNFWLTRGEPNDLESPPSGKRLHVRYSNDDALTVEFLELNSVSSASERYKNANPDEWNVPFPITAVEIYEKVGGTEIEFGPSHTVMPGHNIFRNCFLRGNRVGLALR